MYLVSNSPDIIQSKCWKGPACLTLIKPLPQDPSKVHMGELIKAVTTIE